MSEFPEQEIRQAYDYFKMGKDKMDLATYLDAMKNLGLIFDKKELKEKEGKDNFTADEFFNDYTNKMKTITKDELINAFKAFDPDGTGTIAFEQFKRSFTTYGEKFTKQEFEEFIQKYNIKPEDGVNYNQIVEEFLK